MNIQSIREQRANVIANMRALEAAADKEERDLNKDELEKFNGLKSEMSALDGKLERAEFLADAERSMKSETIRRGNDGTFEQACRSFQVTKAIAAHLAPGKVDAGREFEVSQELARRSGKKPAGSLPPSRDASCATVGSFTFDA